MTANHKMTWKLSVVVVAMLGFSYALVPLYDILCEVTGLNGKTGVVTAEDAVLVSPSDREVTVEFLSHVNRSGAWQFTPEVSQMRVRLGKQYTMRYIASNLRDEAVIAQATPSVSPVTAAAYFNKIECFCFSQQAFERGEQRPLSVTFTINPKLPERVNIISLAYTIFDVTTQPKSNQNV